MNIWYYKLLRKFFRYINPVAHLGESHYSYYFPIIANLSLCVLSEVYAYGVAKNPMVVGVYIIFANVAFIIYFAFRDGIRGGIISAVAAIYYYLYIIFTRHYVGPELRSGIDTTLILAILYFVLAGIIGGLKQQIDKLIEHEAEEKHWLEIIIQQLPVGVLITDSEGRLLKRNKQTDIILGMEIPVGFVIGQDSLVNEKIDGKLVNPSQAPLVQSLQTGEPVIGREFSFERSDGKILNLQVSSAPIHNKFHKIIAAVSISNDITQLKQLEKQKDVFLAIASHELKTPLTSLKAYGQVLQTLFEKKGDLVSAEHMKKMDGQINRLTNLISSLLDVTKIQSGKLEIQEERFDLNALIREVVEELQFTAPKHKLITKLDTFPEIYGDKERIGQVLTNLITNAIKYSPDSELITIMTSCASNIVTVSVIDSGVGIPKDLQEKIFNQFFRVGNSMQNTYPGLGLGLYISSEIIKRIGGRIWVESEGGNGSKFCFTIPL
jgi:PAS domain S-box-containing protein